MGTYATLTHTCTHTLINGIIYSFCIQVIFFSFSFFFFFTTALLYITVRLVHCFLNSYALPGGHFYNRLRMHTTKLNSSSALLFPTFPHLSYWVIYMLNELCKARKRGNLWKYISALWRMCGSQLENKQPVFSSPHEFMHFALFITPALFSGRLQPCTLNPNIWRAYHIMYIYSTRCTACWKLGRWRVGSWERRTCLWNEIFFLKKVSRFQFKDLVVSNVKL